MLTAEEKTTLVKKYQIHSTDTGSAEVQIALLSERIAKMLLHLQKHGKDLHSKRGLLKMVMKRKKLLAYLKGQNAEKFESIKKKVGLS